MLAAAALPMAFAMSVVLHPFFAAAAATDCDPRPGAKDATFFRAPEPTSFVGAALRTTELADGKVLVGITGTFSDGAPKPVERSLLVRLNGDGTIDPSFTFAPGNFERVQQVHMLAVANDGTIAAATSGVGTEGFFYGHFYILREDGGTVFSAYTSVDGSALIRSLAWQPDGRVVLGGNFGAFQPNLPATLARLHADGSLDGSFTPPNDLSLVVGLCVQPDGKILALNSAINSAMLYRLRSDGSRDPDFQPAHFENLPYDWSPRSPVPVVLQPDGKILVAWSFTGVNGVPRASVARLNTNGSLDSTFNPGSGPARIWFPEMDLALQPDGRILLTGDFVAFDRANRRGVVRLQANGSVDLAFDAGASPDFLASITLLRDGRSLVTDFIPSFGGSMWPTRLLGDPAIQVEGPQFIDQERVRLRINSVPYERYVLQASSDLATWRDVATNSVVECQLAFTNNVAGRSAQFYRVQRRSE